MKKLLFIYMIFSLSNIAVSEESDSEVRQWITNKNYEKIKQLIKEAKENDPDVKNYLLSAALTLGKLDVAKWLVKKHDANVNWKDAEGHMDPPIIAAIYHRPFNSSIFEYLLEKSVKLDIQEEKNKDTALIIAARHEFSDTVDFLLKNGASFDVKNEEGDNALIAAVTLDRDDELLPEVSKEDRMKTVKILVQYLLQKNMQDKINEKGNLGETALLRAVRYKYDEIAKYLLVNGADASIEDDSGALPYDFASEGMRSFLDNRFMRAIEAGNFEAVKKNLISKDFINDSIAYTAKSSESLKNIPLFLAVEVYDSDSKIIEYLLDKGANIDKRMDNGYTALILAIELEHFDLVKLLLKYGASPNIQNKDGETALFIAAKNNYDEIIKPLLEYGADSNITNNNDQKPIDVTTSQSIKELLLGEVGTTPTTPSKPKEPAKQKKAEEKGKTGNGQLRPIQSKLEIELDQLTKALNKLSTMLSS